MSERPIWQPSAERIAGSRLRAFMTRMEAHWGVSLPDYAALHRWSVEYPEQFWPSVWEFCGVIGERGEAVLEHPERMPGARWFPQARLNFAENLLRRRDEADALVFRGEDRFARRVSRAELYAQVARLASAMRASGSSTDSTRTSSRRQ